MKYNPKVKRNYLYNAVKMKQEVVVVLQWWEVVSGKVKKGKERRTIETCERKKAVRKGEGILGLL